MTLEELCALLSGIAGFSGKVAYSAFPEESSVSLPVIVYRVVASDNFGADNKVYNGTLEVDIELYTKTKSPEAEALVEATLGGSSIYWEKYETYLDDEKCFEVVYTIHI